MKRTVFCHYAKGISFGCFGVPRVRSTSRAVARSPRTAEADAKHGSNRQIRKPAAKLPFVLTVKTRPILNISLKAEKAKMSEVAQELSKQLKTPVFLGPERQNELLTIEFSELTLEPALQLMSPTVYVDYEIDTGSGAPPKALGIFFYDANQGEPPLTAVVNGSNAVDVDRRQHRRRR